MTRPDTEPAHPKTDQRVVRSRAAILAAGRELYLERGVRGITVKEITARTGIAKTTIYRHWRSRQELVVDILEQTAVELPAIHTDDPLRDVNRILMALWTSVAQPTERSLLVGMIEATIADADLTSLHQDFLTTRGAPLVDAVTRVLGSRAVRTDASPQMLADLLASPVIIRALVRADPPDRKYVARLVRTVLGDPTT